MASLQLLSDTGLLLGALLFAGDEPVDTGPARRDCTIAIVEASKQSDGDLAGTLAFAQGKIYRCIMTKDEEHVTILVHIHEGMSIAVTSQAGSKCQWHVEKLFGKSASTGQCAW